MLYWDGHRGLSVLSRVLVITGWGEVSEPWICVVWVLTLGDTSWQIDWWLGSA